MTSFMGDLPCINFILLILLNSNVLPIKFLLTDLTDNYQINCTKGSSINDVTVLGGQGVEDFVTIVKSLSNKMLDYEGRCGRKLSKLRDVIYERTLNHNEINALITMRKSFIPRPEK